jgi:hypothetical protein
LFALWASKEAVPLEVEVGFPVWEETVVSQVLGFRLESALLLSLLEGAAL